MAKKKSKAPTSQSKARQKRKFRFPWLGFWLLTGAAISGGIGYYYGYVKEAQVPFYVIGDKPAEKIGMPIEAHIAFWICGTLTILAVLKIVFGRLIVRLMRHAGIDLGDDWEEMARDELWMALRLSRRGGERRRNDNSPHVPDYMDRRRRDRRKPKRGFFSNGQH